MYWACMGLWFLTLPAHIDEVWSFLSVSGFLTIGQTRRQCSRSGSVDVGLFLNLSNAVFLMFAKLSCMKLAKKKYGQFCNGHAKVGVEFDRPSLVFVALVG
ncbi:hypothetical protein CROQUDRAFT_348971 [Cronartium quercuum f. sp. fusiforme G11]|uniref:Secreted protein n=1 Tax=Cronartium quercuum f. sp. fusiforme G11 TaxID=708437 RepID=A0A9P6TEV6_9BASI|nr:hypothetical protein CROQUDRAFT_348971 [Cronartium quercuum f. sp. fusiforme G11]